MESVISLDYINIPEEYKINLDDTEEIIKQKITNLYNFHFRYFEKITDIAWELPGDFQTPYENPIIISIDKYVESQLSDILKILYQKKLTKFLGEPTVPSRVINNLYVHYYQNELYKVYSKINDKILNEVGETPYSLNISIGAAGYQPEVLFADSDFLAKINKNYSYNYIIALDPQNEFLNERVQNSYSDDNAPFISKTKDWMKRLLNNNQVNLERIDPKCYSLEVTTPDGNHTKIFFVNAYFFDINFADFLPIISLSSFSIFNCALNRNPCLYYISNKFIYDYFDIVTGTFSVKWDGVTNILPSLKDHDNSWIFYIKQYKQNGGTLEKLESEIFPIWASDRADFNLIEKILSPYFKFNNASTFWSMLGGRRRKVKKTRRVRKMKRNNSRRA